MGVYIDYKFLLQTQATNAYWLKGESHIRPTGVQTPDTERVSTKPPDTVRVSAHKSKGGKGRGERRKGEKGRTVETWYVSRHYDLRTEVRRGCTPNVSKL